MEMRTLIHLFVISDSSDGARAVTEPQRECERILTSRAYTALQQGGVATGFYSLEEEMKI